PAISATFQNRQEALSTYWNKYNVNMKAEGATDDLSRSLGGQGESRDLLPDPKPIFELLTAGRGRPAMATQAEGLGGGPIGRQKALGVARRFESLHTLLSLPSGLV